MQREPIAPPRAENGKLHRSRAAGKMGNRVRAALAPSRFPTGDIMTDDCTPGCDQNFFRQLVEDLPVMFIVVDRKNGGTPLFRYVSPACLELTGYRQEELIGRSSMLHLSYPGDIPPETSFQRLEEKHGVTPDRPFFQSVFRIVTATGHIKWVREVGRILFDAAGAQRGIEALIFDCSQSKALQLLFEKGGDTFLPPTWRMGGFIGSSQPMRALYQRLSLVAQSEAPVLITGETGVGKELAARTIHTLSMPQAPFIALNCGGINENLLENELFGHVPGAYTGAGRAAPGLLAQADRGVLFLDEIGDIPLAMQVKLLRTLDGYGYIPVGGTRTQTSKFRLICATNKNLENQLATGRMRQDFFYRIHTLPVSIPPLREHKEDIPLLTDYFLKMFSQPDQEMLFPNHVRLSLQEHDWPGNVRELRNVIHRFLTLGELNLPARQPVLPLPDVAGTSGADMPPDARSQNRTEQTPSSGGMDREKLPSDERAAIKRLREIAGLRDALARSGGHVENAAALLGVHPRTLYRKLKKYGLKR